MWTACPKLRDFRTRHAAKQDSESIHQLIRNISQQYKLHLNPQSFPELVGKLQGKISALDKARAKAVKTGGKNFNTLQARWKKQQYTLRLKATDISEASFVIENSSLRKKVNTLGGLANKLRLDLDVALTKIKKLTMTNHNIIFQKKRLAKKLLFKLRGFARKKRKDKAYEDYSKRQKRRLRGDFITDANLTLDFLNYFKLLPTKVTVFNQVTKTEDTFNLCPDPLDKTLKFAEKLKMSLWAKEKYNVSDAAYKELSSIIPGMPRLYQLQQHVLLVNRSWNLLPISANRGWQIHLQDVVIERATHLIKTLPNLDHLDIKISGDGTQVGRSLSLVQMSVTILQEGQICKTCTGNHLVALFKGPEKYEILVKALEDMRDQASTLTSIELPGHPHPISITWYLGGDYKFILSALGLDGATANYACAWCKIPKEDRSKLDSVTNYSMTDAKLHARTIEEISNLCDLPKRCQKYNCSHPPLFPNIDIINVVVDLLHMFLRIGDRLLQLLILECRREDGIEERHRFNDIHREKWPNMSRLESFINETCKIPFQWEVQQDSKKLNYRDLRGPELKTLFKNINILEIIPDSSKATDMQTIWTGFYEIILLLHNDNMLQDEIGRIQSKIVLWFKLYTETFPAKNVTPYIHILHCHVVEMLQIHGQISMFTQEGLEKLNDQSTVNFFGSTNRHGSLALKQLLLKSKRVAFYQDNGYSRERDSRQCSQCGQVGHYKVTCVS